MKEIVNSRNIPLKKWKTLWFTTVLAVIQIVSSLSCKLSSVTTNFKKSLHKTISQKLLEWKTALSKITFSHFVKIWLTHIRTYRDAFNQSTKRVASGEALKWKLSKTGFVKQETFNIIWVSSQCYRSQEPVHLKFSSLLQNSVSGYLQEPPI